MADWTLKDLEYWDDAHPRARSTSSGSTATRRSSRSATTARCSATWRTRGMPSHYPHWSYGKSLREAEDALRPRRLRPALRDGDQLEPALAYLMRDNSLLPADPHHRARLRPQRLLQEQLHLHSGTRAEYTIEHLQGARRPRARLRRGPLDRPRQGRGSARRRARPVAAVPAQPRRSRSCRATSSASAASRPRSPAPDPFQRIHRRAGLRRARPAQGPARARRGPAALHPRPQSAICGWEKDLLTIVHEEAQYFIPQIETKIMNEGWASYWHKRS